MNYIPVKIKRDRRDELEQMLLKMQAASGQRISLQDCVDAVLAHGLAAMQQSNMEATHA